MDMLGIGGGGSSNDAAASAAAVYDDFASYDDEDVDASQQHQVVADDIDGGKNKDGREGIRKSRNDLRLERPEKGHQMTTVVMTVMILHRVMRVSMIVVVTTSKRKKNRPNSRGKKNQQRRHHVVRLDVVSHLNHSPSWYLPR